VPVFTAGTAVVAAMRALGARRIGLVSPYPEKLDAACGPYWESFGLTVAAKAKAPAEGAAFHPIYAMAGAGCLTALESLRDADVDAIILLGTGMPTLGPMLAVAGRAGPPAISCNVALAWAATDSAQAGTLPGWIDGTVWGARLRLLYPAACP
jgi:maleate isomerase